MKLIKVGASDEQFIKYKLNSNTSDKNKRNYTLSPSSLFPWRLSLGSHDLMILETTIDLLNIQRLIYLFMVISMMLEICNSSQF
jgi:hypothetical protein